MKPLRLILLIYAVSCISCKSSSVTAPEQLATIKGSVIIRDPSCQEMADKSGVMVSIYDTKFSGTSDKDGNWTISHVPEGYYHLKFSKDGFSTTTSGSLITVVDSGVIPFDALNGQGGYLTQNSNRSALLDTSTLHDPLHDGEIRFTVTHLDSLDTPESFYFGTGYVFIGSTSNVNPQDTSSYKIILSDGQSGQIFLDSLSLRNDGFKFGDTAYAVATTSSQCTVGYYQEWTSVSTFRTVYTGFGPKHSAPIALIVK